MLLAAAHRPARVAPWRREPLGFGEAEHLREHVHRLVGLVGLVAELVVQGRDMGTVHHPHGEIAEFGHGCTW